MASLHERLQTFEGWTLNFISADSMAAAGFYYTQVGDRVRCAFCDYEVGNWIEGDDPMLDHRRWSPFCSFIRNQSYNIPLSSTQPSAVNECVTLKTYSRKRKREDEDDDTSPSNKNLLCKLCYNHEMCVVFLPCRHLLTCATCALSLNKCAVCRNTITTTMHVFIS